MTKTYQLFFLIIASWFYAYQLIAKPLDTNVKNNYQLKFNKSIFQYIGAFRIKNEKYGDSRIAYTSGGFTINETGKSIFIVGHNNDQAIAEFNIPKLVKTFDISQLNFTQKPIQNFTKVLNRTNTGNPQNINHITGMDIIEGNLFVNAIDYYDAPADNTHTTLIIDDPNRLSNSKVRGFFNLNGRAHAAGWISEISSDWAIKLNASYIVGSASNYPIDSRSSMGPSAFSSYLDTFAGISVNYGLIPTTALIDYSLKHPLNTDFYNKSKKNHIWTEVSWAIYGFIIPNTDFYLVLGSSGGHNSGVGYKINQDNGYLCGGPCSFAAGDNYNYYWLYDVKEMSKVMKHELKPYQLKPINYGEMKLPFQTPFHRLIGADFDFTSEKLYLLLQNADNLQSRYESSPVMIVYQLKH